MVGPLRSVVLVDPHLISREGTLALMRSDPSVVVLGDCATGHHAVALCAELRPDVAIVDAGVIDPPLSETVAQLRCLVSPPRVIVLTTGAAELVVRIAFEAGAAACLVRGRGYARLSETIHAVASGEAVIDVFSAHEFVGGAVGEFEPIPLTPRETDVLRLIAVGMATKAIASTLKLSPKTVETHRGHIYRKLKMRTVHELVRYAVAKGLTGPAGGKSPGQ